MASAGFRLTKPTRRSLVANIYSKQMAHTIEDCDYIQPIIDKMRSNTIAIRAVKRMCIQQQRTLKDLHLKLQNKENRIRLLGISVSYSIGRITTIPT